MLVRFIRHFCIALQFFTRIPVTGRWANWVGFSPDMLRSSAAHFPGVGCVVGVLTALVFAGFVKWLPPLDASVWVAAVLSTVFSVMLTGGFHEDGLADTADGLGGGLTSERAIEIMKDSRIGTYGALAIVLALMAKLGLLVSLFQTQMSWAVAGIFAAHVTSRLTPLFLIRWLPYVGDTAQSKSKPLAESIGTAGLCIGILWWLIAIGAVSYFLPALPLLAGTLGSVIFTLWMAWRLHKRIQGFTGDGLGATQQLAEIGFYLGLILAI